MIRIDNLQFSYPGQTAATLAIQHWQAASGSRVLVYGPSGCGKSTLLALITGLVQAQQGDVSLIGQSLTQLPQRARDQLRADALGVIFQQFNLLPYASVIENVQLPALFSSQRRQQAQQCDGTVNQHAARLLSALVLPEHLWTAPVHKLSVGQQQRVAAARALFGKPAWIIADEPTSALDTDLRQQFLALLFAQCQEQQSGLLMVSHDPALAAQFDQQLDLPTLNQAGQARTSKPSPQWEAR